MRKEEGRKKGSLRTHRYHDDGGERRRRDADEDEEKAGEKSAAPPRRKFAVRGISGVRGSGIERRTRRYDLIKGSLLPPATTFLPWLVNESNFSSDFRLPRGFIRTRSYNAASTERWAKKLGGGEGWVVAEGYHVR